MADILIKKGHSIRIAGEPGKEIVPASVPSTVALQPTNFRYTKPKLLVREGDFVKTGSPIFFDKRNPAVKWASPGTGTISQIIYGERRVIRRVIIRLENDEESITHKPYNPQEILTLNRQQVIDSILRGNLLPFIRQRPFNKVANPTDSPKAIFISGVNSAPLTPDLELVLEKEAEMFQAGLDVLSRLTNGKVHLTIKEGSASGVLTQAKNVVLHTVKGPHPAGNTGIQIHHIDPINPGDIVWTVSAQHVVILGKFFITGKFDPTIIVSVAGPSVNDPVHLKARIGIKIDSLLKGRVNDGLNRIISGDVLTGAKVDRDDYLGFYDSTLSVIPEKGKSEFLGFLKPGSNETRYSLTRAFATFKKIPFKFTALKNGGERALVPINAWEEVVPMDILPNFLYRSILAQDIEEMEKLGILECDEEDFALCSFACPSKIDVGKAIRHGLDLMESEV